MSIFFTSTCFAGKASHIAWTLPMPVAYLRLPHQRDQNGPAPVTDKAIQSLAGSLPRFHSPSPLSPRSPMYDLRS